MADRDGDAGAAAVAARPPQGPHHGECKLGWRFEVGDDDDDDGETREEEREEAASIITARPTPSFCPLSGCFRADAKDGSPERKRAEI